MLDPVSLYKGGEVKKIPAIDAPGWIAAGWSTSLDDSVESPELPPDPPPPSDPPPKTPKATTKEPPSEETVAK